MVLICRINELESRLWWFRRHDLPEWRRYGIWSRIAPRLPRRLKYAVLIEAWAAATPGDVHPDDTRAIDLVRQYAERIP